ncbi:hypothetical protein BTM36_24040, partial [Herbaspirillum sp. VT-16-41]
AGGQIRREAVECGLARRFVAGATRQLLFSGVERRNPAQIAMTQQGFVLVVEVPHATRSFTT